MTNRRGLVAAAAALLAAGCAAPVQIELVSTTAPAPAPDPLRIGLAATDTYGGWIPDGQTLSPFDVSNPALAQLDPSLLNAVQDATRAAAAQGVDLRITSGWRSKGFQQRLFDDAVGKYGSVDIARQFVASPDVSKHVVGQAVDVAPVDADNWLIRNGARFGLCQVYANELWHFELAVDQQGTARRCGRTPRADQPRATFSTRSAASTRPGNACNRFDAASRRVANC